MCERPSKKEDALCSSKCSYSIYQQVWQPQDGATTVDRQSSVGCQ